MPRFVVGARSTGAGSATLPIISLYNTAAVNAHIVEIGVFNTTTTAVAVALCRLSTTGTQGAALTEQSLDGVNTAASACQGFNTHTVAPTLVDMGYRTTLGAVAGAGIIWTFGGITSLVTALGTTQGFGIFCPTGTGQICDVYFVWDE